MSLDTADEFELGSSLDDSRAEIKVELRRLILDGFLKLNLLQLLLPIDNTKRQGVTVTCYTED